jgi:hypothetical protein
MTFQPSEQDVRRIGVVWLESPAIDHIRNRYQPMLIPSLYHSPSDVIEFHSSHDNYTLVQSQIVQSQLPRNPNVLRHRQISLTSIVLLLVTVCQRGHFCFRLAGALLLGAAARQGERPPRLDQPGLPPRPPDRRPQRRSWGLSLKTPVVWRVSVSGPCLVLKNFEDFSTLNV